MLVQVDRDSSIPLYEQIKNQLGDLILSGVIGEGSRLPATRKLAKELDVNRNTVLRAYQELTAEGLVEGRTGGGTVVTEVEKKGKRPRTLPLLWREMFTNWESTFHDWVEESSSRDGKEMISFDRGTPSPELFPLEMVQEIVSEVLSGGPEPIRYSSPQGDPKLRKLLAEQMELMGIEANPSQILILSGSEQGIYITIQALTESGEGIIAEAPTYPGMLHTLSANGRHIYTVPMDKEGLRLDLLEGILSHHRPKFIYTMPTFQNPTGKTQSLKKRKQLLELAYHYQIPILEDAPYYHLRYEGEHLPPIKAMDQNNHVIYLSTFSKTLFPGLRVGWMVAPEEVIERFTSIKKSIDLCTGTLSQSIAFQLVKRQSRHLEEVLPIYRRRRDTLIEALDENCEGLISWQRPEGGFFIWGRLTQGLRTESLHNEARKAGVNFIPGRFFFPKGRGGDYHLRLSFSQLTEDRIREGIGRLSKAIHTKLKEGKEKVEVETGENKPLV